MLFRFYLFVQLEELVFVCSNMIEKTIKIFVVILDGKCLAQV